jgi:PAS domain S-box-containing protein
MLGSSKTNHCAAGGLLHAHAGEAVATAESPAGLTLDEAHWRLVQSLPAAVYICDAEGRILMYNEAAAELWGRRPTVGVDLWCGSYRIFHLDGSRMPLDECPMAIAIREGRSVPGREIIVERMDGQRRYVLPHPEPLRDSQGRLVGAINMLVDITESRRGAEVRNLLASIVDSSEDAIVSKLLDGRITSWNAGAERMFGYTAEEAVGRHITMLIPPENWAEEDEILARLGRGERIEHFETMRVDKAGRPVHVAITISPIRDATGRIVGASKVARDISARREHEEEVERLNAQLQDRVRELQTLLNVLPIGVFIAHDPECRRITGNAAGAAMLRLASPEANASKTASESERGALPFQVLRDGKEMADADLPMQRCARTGEVVAGEECEVVFEDGTRKNLYEFATPLLDGGGQVRGCVGAFVDITDRKHYEAQMRLVMAELNHRVKNTLAVVDATAQQTLRHTSDLQSFGVAFGSRLRALAQAHGLLTQTDWQGAELAGLALAELRPRVVQPDQVQLSGPAVVLRPNAALALHMVLHELSTNAAKYGALSTSGGSV